MAMINTFKNKLIVSCQAQPGEPLEGSDIMAKMAKAALIGGAAAIRAEGVNDIIAIKELNDALVIGLIKKDYDDSEIYITSTKKEIMELVNSGCEIIAMDATLRTRPNDELLVDLLKLVHDNNLLAMADISTLEEAINADKLGFDLISTTLAGYTPYSKKMDGPDLELLEACVKNCKTPVIAEGRIRDKEDLMNILKCNPFSVVIGGAITRPQQITKRFVDCFNK
jgi:N-acylglucosamine-6-phosphate 2-epimerase